MDWVAYQAYLEGRLPGNSTVNDEEAMDKCVEGLSNAIQEALAASSPCLSTALYTLVFRMKYA
jgi:hypothetical protein